MNYPKMTQRRSKPPTAEPKQSRPVDAAFDIWLERSLHKLFDDVAKEPVPDELLDLIRDSRDK